MIKGYLFTINTSCDNSLKDILTVFIPTRNLKKAESYVISGGVILSKCKYEVDICTLTKDEYEILQERLIEIENE